jgi:hypothetical protein
MCLFFPRFSDSPIPRFFLCPFAGPHQYLPVLIAGHVFGVDQFGFEVFQILIIQVEAPFQRAIGRTAALLQ